MLEGKRSAQGYFELAAEGGTIILRCSWPFDLDADEWIYIQNRYAAADYAKAVSDAAHSDRNTGKADGISGGLLEVTRLNSGFLIEFSRPQSGWHACSLQLHVRRPVGELSPQHLPFRVVCGRLFIQHLYDQFKDSTFTCGPASVQFWPSRAVGSNAHRSGAGREMTSERMVQTGDYSILYPATADLFSSHGPTGLLDWPVRQKASHYRRQAALDAEQESDSSCRYEHSQAWIKHIPLILSEIRRAVQ